MNLFSIAGVLSIPFDKMADFYREYAAAVSIGEKVFVVRSFVACNKRPPAARRQSGLKAALGASKRAALSAFSFPPQVEQKTKTYNFFLDMDYKDHDELTVADVKNLSQIICDKVRSFRASQRKRALQSPRRSVFSQTSRPRSSPSRSRRRRTTRSSRVRASGSSSKNQPV